MNENVVDTLASVEDVKKFILEHSYKDVQKELLQIWLKFSQSEPMKLLSELEQFIRFYKPKGWVGAIQDFDFSELKCIQYVWIFFGGNIEDIDLRWYKKAAVEEFFKQKDL